MTAANCARAERDLTTVARGATTTREEATASMIRGPTCDDARPRGAAPARATEGVRDE